MPHLSNLLHLSNLWKQSNLSKRKICMYHDSHQWLLSLWLQWSSSIILPVSQRKGSLQQSWGTTTGKQDCEAPPVKFGTGWPAEPKEEGALVVVVLLPVAAICAEQCEVDFHTWFDFGPWQWFLPNVGRILTPWASPDFLGSRSHTKCTRHQSIWKQD